MKINIELRPVQSGTSTFSGKPYFDQILCMVGGYPSALVHIDTFYTVNGNDIYNRLVVGETVKVTAEFEIV